MRKGLTLLETVTLSMTPRLSLAKANTVKTVELGKAALGVTGSPWTSYVVVELAVTSPAKVVIAVTYADVSASCPDNAIVKCNAVVGSDSA